MKNVTHILSKSVALFAFLLSASSIALAEFEEGKHYKVLNTQESKEPMVTEVFWLGCGHCYRMEPLLEKWLASDKSKGVKFDRIPAMFGRQWVAHAHLYYIAEALGVSEKMVPMAFNEIHQRKNPLLSKEQQKMFLVGKLGVKAEEFDRVYGSEQMRTVMESANKKVIEFGLSGVPTIIVNNKYQVDGRMAGDQPTILKVVDYLLSKNSK